MILEQIREDLLPHVDRQYGDGFEKYFKGEVKTLGVRIPIVRKIANKHYKQVKHLPKQEVYSLAEELMKSKYNEERHIGISWVRKMHKQYEKKDFKTFEKWIDKHFDNWGLIDDFCTHAMHDLIVKYPELVPRVKAWAKSKNMWLRRASAVSFITTDKSYYVVNHNLEDVFEVAEALLTDEEDLVQKGYGWMLKAASLGNQKKVYEFVLEHKHKMPRTALRYAIEHMPKDMKKKAMSRGEQT